MEDTLVFLDAGFLSKLSKHFGKGKYLVYDIVRFSEHISKKQNLSCKNIFYYTAPPFMPGRPSKKETKRKKLYDDFISKLSKNKNLTVREGRCQRLKINNKFEYIQKGVDSLVVIDLMNVCIDYPEIKKIIIIACDSDFVPVIDDLKRKGIKTTLYTYYERGRKAKFSTSNELIKSVDKYVLLLKENFTSFQLTKIQNANHNIK
ncbi:NYN domain-containing protein [Candidatus Woesearchaeota archaeon]|nr:NYN domain-containing protein [Candidatus Woesearchaeota archaeon]